MNRIFPMLLVLVGALVAVALLLGLRIGDLAGEPSREAVQAKNAHFLAGVVAVLAVVLVESIVVTYFIGTSRWCREVSEAYRLDADFLRRSMLLKRRTFPVALAGMLLAVGIASLGAAADPAAAVQARPPLAWTWADLHLAGVLLGGALLGASFVVEWINIDRHGRLIADILTEVRRIRQEKGLEV